MVSGLGNVYRHDCTYGIYNPDILVEPQGGKNLLKKNMEIPFEIAPISSLAVTEAQVITGKS